MIWKCADKSIEYGKRVLIMGIVNITPDSFSDGGDCFLPEKAVKHALQLQQDGADIIDLGAQSTRPGYTQISEQEEWNRLRPVLKLVREKISVPVSVDTFYPGVALNAIKNGASIINDISGIISQEMAQIVKKTGAGWIIMHNGPGGTAEVADFFKKSVCETDALKIDRAQICFDMGIGFGKTRRQDMSLIANIDSYKIKEFPLLLGASRKRVIGEGSGQKDPKSRIYGNIAADTAAVFGGVDIIRLHDVKNEKQGIYMAERLKAEKTTFPRL